MGQTVAATEEEQPSHPSRRSRGLLPAASKSYIPRPVTRKEGMLPISLVYANRHVLVLVTVGQCTFTLTLILGAS